MRIISGKHRGRTIMLPKDGKVGGKTIRPTSDFAREGIFNILSHGKYSDGENALIGARVLDVCAGTGAFGLEALSRGAGIATFIDSNRDVTELIRANVERFGEAQASHILHADAAHLPMANQRYNLIYVDPPYSLGLIPSILKSLHAGKWLEDGALVIAEHDERDVVPVPEYFSLLDSRKYGRAIMTLMRYGASSES